MHPDRVFTKGGRPAGRRRSCCPSRSAPASCWPAASDDEKAAAIAGMRGAQPGRRRGAAGARTAPCTPSPTSPGSAWPATGGRWPSAAACALVFDAAALPLYAGALAAAEAGMRTGGDARNREHLERRVTSRRRRRPRGAVLRPADVGRPARRRRRRPSRPSSRRPGFIGASGRVEAGDRAQVRRCA